MKLVILARDGVINEALDSDVKSPEEWQPIPGSLDAIARLNHGGWRVVVATNQSGLRRKRFDIETLNRIHDKMLRQLAEVGGSIEAIFICPCLPKDQCECLKPNPGMLLAVAQRLHTSLDEVLVVGDTQADLEAARNAGAVPALVRTGRGIQTLSDAPPMHDVKVFDDLAHAADTLLIAGTPT